MAIDGEPVDSVEDITRKVTFESTAGDELELAIIREGAKLQPDRDIGGISCQRLRVSRLSERQPLAVGRRFLIHAALDGGAGGRGGALAIDQLRFGPCRYRA